MTPDNNKIQNILENMHDWKLQSCKFYDNNKSKQICTSEDGTEGNTEYQVSYFFLQYRTEDAELAIWIKQQQNQ